MLVGVFAYDKFVKKGTVPQNDKALNDSTFSKLLRDKFYVDELYEMLIVKPAYSFSTLMSTFFEEKIIHRATNGAGQLTLFLSGKIRKTQNGFISYYLFAMALGVLGFITIFILF